jgi:hypothetical protein
MKKALTIVSIIGSSVSYALAQIQVGGQAAGTTANGGALLGLLALAQTFLNRLVPFAIGLGVLGFLWFLVEFIWRGSSDPVKKKEAISGMTYSIIALFLMVAVWGIVAMLANLLGVGLAGTIPAPTLPQ